MCTPVCERDREQEKKRDLQECEAKDKERGLKKSKSNTHGA